MLPLLSGRHSPIAGFSVTSPSQVVAALTFGYNIRRHLPDVKVVLGGQWISMYREELLKRGDLHDFYDFLITHEGETPLLHLMKHLQGLEAISEVPGLIYWNNGWKQSESAIRESLMDIPAPDFSGLPLEKYRGSSEALSLTIETARGC